MKGEFIKYLERSVHNINTVLKLRRKFDPFNTVFREFKNDFMSVIKLSTECIASENQGEMTKLPVHIPTVRNT